ncbi:MAG TPA: cytochrome c [Terriglobales bacterium]|nr:cytochrome c [Terriglobales bacterium]
MARRTYLVLLFCAAAITVTTTAAFAVISLDFSSEADPPFIEQRVARSLLALNLRFRRLPKPPADSPSRQDIDRGAHLYEQQCSFCHGSRDGNPAVLAKSFSPRPPQFAIQGVTNEPTINAYVIRHGIRWTAMPAFPTLSDDDAWRIARYLETFNHTRTP